MVVSVTEPLLGQGCQERNVDDVDASCLGKAEGTVAEARTHRKSSFWQTTMNCVNIFLGLGLLALPASLQQGGWLSLLILLGFAVVCCYTGVLLARCLEAPGSSLKTYQDVGGAAYGARGRILTTVIFYTEVMAYLIANTIALGDNLARLFPDAGLDVDLPGLHLALKPSQALVLVALIFILPTTWLRDMRSLSFVSVGGVVTSLVITATVAWAGAFGGVGFHHVPPLLNLGNLPMVSGVLAYCYAVHIIIPSMYQGMQQPSQFPKMMVVSTVIASSVYAGLAVLGATMFGSDTLSQITLNIPKSLPVAKIALWTTVLTPLGKFGLCIAPVAEQIEALLPFPSHSKTHLALGTSIRTALVLAVVAVAFTVPFFQNMLALCGALVSMATAVTLPAVFYIRLFRSSLSRTQITCALACIVWGIFFAVVGTGVSLEALLQKLNDG